MPLVAWYNMITGDRKAAEEEAEKRMTSMKEGVVVALRRAARCRLQRPGSPGSRVD